MEITLNEAKTLKSWLEKKVQKHLVVIKKDFLNT